MVEQDIKKVIEKPYVLNQNLSKEEKTALKELIQDKDIVIKPADKGGAICIQDYEKCRQEILSQLSDAHYYKKLDHDPTLLFQGQLLTYLKEAEACCWISEHVFGLFYSKYPVCPVFYILPKIHKSLNNPPGRPIVAQSDSLWSPLSTYVDHYIKPTVQNLPSYIRDSSDSTKVYKLKRFIRGCLVVDS